MLALVALVSYFQSRSERATIAETLIATVWLAIRRIICFSVSLLCAAGVVLLSRQIISGNVTLIYFVGVATLIAVGYIAYHCGRFGAGNRYLDFNDDKSAHNERRKRYGWRW